MTPPSPNWPWASDDRAAAPVIGVILMVAVAIVLAAVVSFYVLGVGRTPSPAPNAKFTFDYDSTGTLTIDHDGGKTIDSTNTLELTVKYTNSAGAQRTETWTMPVDSESSITLSEDPKSGTTVRVIWTAPDGEVSTPIGTDQVP